jgi:nucleoside-diphosphate-sugar epimerase
MKVFLTGGTGFIGQPLTKALLTYGWQVVALVRKPGSPATQTLVSMGAHCVRGDITDQESLRAGMTGADIVIHNAGQYEFGLDDVGRKRMHSVNVIGTDNVLGLAAELAIPRTVYISTVQAFGETGPQPRTENFTRQTACRTTYEQSKTEAHEIACQYQKRGLHLIIVCPHQVIGPNEHSAFGYFLRLYINRLLPPLGWAPNSILCCVDVNDLAAGIALATKVDHPGEIYIFCGEPQSFREILTCWGQKPGGSRPVVWLPAKLAAWLFALLEPLHRLLGLPAFISRETVTAGSINWYFSSDKAQRELGWTHHSAEAMWFSTIDGELELLASRRKRDLISRLKPVEATA